MLTHPTLEQLHQLGLAGMAKAFAEIETSAEAAQLTRQEWLGLLLDREVGSMTEFKQIVGRGTRVHEDTKKFYFTLIDFRGATNHFADPDFDGEPVQIYEPG